jgi:hypothetical protein
MKCITILLGSCVLFLLNACNTVSETNLLTESTGNRFLKPPLPQIDVPFESFNIQAELGDTLVYKSGSVIVFPPNALVDEQNNPIKGEVVVTYREFADPVDFFLSGVPMEYDSAGTTYTFESSGMCEIYVHQNGQPVFVNQSAQPEINLMSFTENPDHNLYYLDTVSGTWVNRGKDEIRIANNSNTPIDFEDEKYNQISEKLVAPIAPLEASSDKALFDISIAPESIEELQVYNNMKFEFVDEKAVNPTDADIEYSDVRVDETAKEGVYRVIFSDEISGIEKSYLAKPVYEGKDYEEALAVFKTKQKEYERLLKNRKDTEKAAEAKYQMDKELFLAEQKRIEEVNELIRVRNLEIEAQNEEIRADYQRLVQERARKQALDIQLQKERQEQLKREGEKRAEQNRLEREELAIRQEQFKQEREELIKQQQEAYASAQRTSTIYNEVVRSFRIERFGTWNCDRPLIINGPTIITNFIDQDGKKLEINQFSAVYKDINSIMTYYKGEMNLPKNNETMLWTIINERFAYVSYDEFAKAKNFIHSGRHTFTLTIHPDIIRSERDIRRLVRI